MGIKVVKRPSEDCALQPLHGPAPLPPHVPPELLPELNPAHGPVPDREQEDCRPQQRDSEPDRHHAEGETGDDEGRRQALGGGREVLERLPEQEGRVRQAALHGREDAGDEGGVGEGQGGDHGGRGGRVDGGDCDDGRDDGLEQRAGGGSVNRLAS